MAALPLGGRRLELGLASLAIAAVVVVVGYEVSARIRHLNWLAQSARTDPTQWLTVRSANPHLMWEYRPHATGMPDGMPDRTVTTNGHGMGQALTMQARYEALANTVVHDGRVEGMNSGVGGYSALRMR